MKWHDVCELLPRHGLVRLDGWDVDDMGMTTVGTIVDMGVRSMDIQWYSLYFCVYLNMVSIIKSLLK